MNIFKRIKNLEKEVQELRYQRSRLETILDEKFKAMDALNNTPKTGYLGWLDNRTETALHKLALSMVKEAKK